ncbi:MAG: hypothetical protein AAFS00_14710, partial [Bacteroidota bacterium]
TALAIGLPGMCALIFALLVPLINGMIIGCGELARITRRLEPDDRLTIDMGISGSRKRHQ